VYYFSVNPKKVGDQHQKCPGNHQMQIQKGAIGGASNHICKGCKVKLAGKNGPNPQE